MKFRRAGHHENGRPVAQQPLDVSSRSAQPPGKLGAIRGLAQLVDDARQSEAFWREVWRDELQRRDVGRVDGVSVVRGAQTTLHPTEQKQ
jgi:hypothetical protein